MQVTGYNWYTFGITHQHASAEDRQLFALSSEELTQYYEHIFPENECAGFITNTCNRTSFFLFGKHPEHIEQHFLQSRNQSDILEIGERHIGRKALNHLFEVIAGLDSQILGDFEIVGQIKAAFDASKNHGATLGIVEKLVNQAIHSSRRIKNETGLSQGTSSTSYAAVQFLRNTLPHFNNAKILVLGMGQIGKRTLDNLVAEHGHENLFIANRSFAKSERQGKLHGVQALTWDEAFEKLSEFDAVVSAVSAPQPVFTTTNILGTNISCIVDLSIPFSVSTELQSQPNLVIANVDVLSQSIAKQMEARKHWVPKAHDIIREELDKYKEWELAVDAVTVIKALQQRLENQWQEKNLDAEKIERVSAKIEARLFERIRKNPKELKELEKQLYGRS